MAEVELVLDAHAVLGEGAAWSVERQRLYWVDIFGRMVHVYNPVDGSDRAIPVGQAIGTLAPRQKGGLVLALKAGIYFMDETSGGLEQVCAPESHLPNNRFNDGKCDPAGRFWAGTMSDKSESGAGALYRLDADLSVHKMVDHITTSNGMIWSLDARTMYYIDTPTRTVWAFDYDNATGALSRRRAAITIPKEEGGPDGMTIDAEGMLWVAMWEGWQVNRYNPLTGQKLASIPVPVARVTSMAFSGPDLDTLYITTAQMKDPDAERERQPHAGGLFKIKPGVRGVPGFSFAG